MSLSRRELLKAQAAAVAAAAAGIAVPAAAQPVAGGVGSLEIKWSKAPCRFCGTGCGIRLPTVAVHCRSNAPASGMTGSRSRPSRSIVTSGWGRA